MKSGTDSWVEARVGTSLEPGDTIKAGDSSRAIITFFEGSTIELQANTEIEVSALDLAAGTGSTTITLKQQIGKTISRVTKLADPASRYRVETPAGVAAVRGSIMRVDVLEGGKTLITNIQGNIWAIAQGVEIQIPVGRTCVIIPGQPPRLIGRGASSGGRSAGSSPPPTDAITISGFASNDAGGELDPSSQGDWALVDSSLVWTGNRYTKNVASASVRRVDESTITVNINNAYPGYWGSVGLTINNGASFPVEIYAVTVEKSGSPHDPTADSLTVVLTGALDTSSGGQINPGDEALGGIHSYLEDDAPQNNMYTVTITVLISQVIP